MVMRMIYYRYSYHCHYFIFTTTTALVVVVVVFNSNELKFCKGDTSVSQCSSQKEPGRSTLFSYPMMPFLLSPFFHPSLDLFPRITLVPIHTASISYLSHLPRFPFHLSLSHFLFHPSLPPSLLPFPPADCGGSETTGCVQ